MSYSRIWIHAVWTTKNRAPFLSDEVRRVLGPHIKGNARIKKIYLVQVNGWVDHLHALITLGVNQSVSEVMQLIKGESSHWINKNKITRQLFACQDDFYAASVGNAEISLLQNYIANQEIHHRKFDLKSELDKFLKENNLDNLVQG